MDSLLHIPERFVPASARILLQWINWFRPEDDGPPSYHPEPARDVWRAMKDEQYEWMPAHPGAPTWVRDVLDWVAAGGKFDCYRAVYIHEFLLAAACSEEDDVEDLHEHLTERSVAPSVVIQGEDLEAWLFSSDSRGQHLTDVICSGRERPRVKLSEYASLAQSQERNEVANAVMSRLTSDRLIRPWLVADFDARLDVQSVCVSPLWRARDLLAGAEHEELTQIVETLDRHQLLTEPWEVFSLRPASHEQVRSRRLERSLARATVVIDVLGARIANGTR